MKIQIKVKGSRPLKEKFKSREEQVKSTTVLVGYTANYATYVHEMVGANFKRPGSQAKFLEAPARRFKNILGKIVANHQRSGGSFKDGIMLAGLRLQRESMKVVPVDTGNLRASAFTRFER